MIRVTSLTAIQAGCVLMVVVAGAMSADSAQDSQALADLASDQKVAAHT